ncbi:hypothetical protein X975_09731, partial [Stegodyphus mimosarum]
LKRHFKLHTSDDPQQKRTCRFWFDLLPYWLNEVASKIKRRRNLSFVKKGRGNSLYLPHRNARRKTGFRF